jgi:hypothetical protein
VDLLCVKNATLQRRSCFCAVAVLLRRRVHDYMRNKFFASAYVIKKLMLLLVVCRQQMNILRESGKCQSVNDILPLVQVRDVMQFMPQMKYMFSRMNAGGEENPSKRQRTS